MKLLTWNVKGLNSGAKRRQVFHYVKKQNPDIVCLQETHINKKETKYLENNILGTLHVSASEKRKKGVAVYVNKRLGSKKVLSDEEGRYVGVEVRANNVDILLIGIYAPFEKKELFF